MSLSAPHIWPVLGAAGRVSGLDVHLPGTMDARWLLHDLLHTRCPSYTLRCKTSVSISCPFLVGLSIDALSVESGHKSPV